MQDRFKFRVWDETEKNMVYFDGIFYNKKPYTEGSSFPQYESSPHYHKLSDLMQSTGLKDKSGKLIYEGDIVKDLTYSCDVRYLCAFIPIFGGLGLLRKQDLDDYNFCKENWENYGINKEVRRLDNRFKLANQGNKLKCFSMHELKMNDLEVIGNVYENLELLEGLNDR